MTLKTNRTYTWLLCLCVSLLVFSARSYARKEGVELTVTDPYAELRTGAGRGYPIFHVVEKGDIIRLYKRRTDWYKAETLDGKIGWIKRNQLINTLGPDGSEIDFSTPDWQDYVARRWEFGVLGGDSSGAQSITNYIGYHVTHNISAELKYTQAFGQFSNSKLLTINAVHQPFPEWNISPFFTLGSGVITISPSSDLVQVEDRQDSVLSVGGGFFFYLSRSFLLRLEYNNHTILTTRESNEEVDEWKAGFSIFF